MKNLLLAVFLLLFGSAYGQEPKLVLPVGDISDLSIFRFSPDCKKIAKSASNGTVKLWDSETGVLLLNLNLQTNGIMDVQFAPDGNRLFIVSFDSIWVWDFQIGDFIRRFNGYKICISQDASKLAIATITKVKDESINYTFSYYNTEILDGNNFEQISKLDDCDAWVTSMKFSPDCKKLMILNDDSLAKIWDINTGKKYRKFVHPLTVTSSNFSPNSTYIITFCKDLLGRIWDIETGTLVSVLRGHENSIETTSFNLDGTKVVSGSVDHTAKVWDVGTGKQLFNLTGHSYSVKVAEFSENGKKILTCGGGNVKIWNAFDGKQEQVLPGDFACFNRLGTKILTDDWSIWDAITGIKLVDLATSMHQQCADHNFVIRGSFVISTGEPLIGTKSYLRKFDLNRASLSVNVEFDDDLLASICLSPEETKIATSGGYTLDGILKIWDLPTLKLLKKISAHDSKISCISISKGSERICTGSWDKTLKYWDMNTGNLVQQFNGHKSPINCNALSTDGKYLVSGALDSSIIVWEIATGAKKLVIKDSTGQADFVAFTHDGKKIISKTNFPTGLKIWNTASGNLIFNFTSLYGQVTLSPDGKRILEMSNGTINIIDVDNLSASFKIPLTSIISADFSSDFNRIITNTGDGRVNIYDGLNGHNITSLRQDNIYSMALSQDNRYLLTVLNNGNLKIWNGQFGNELISLYYLNDSDYFCQTPIGYYKCPPAAAKLLHYVTKDLKVITFEQLDVKYNRPDKVLEAIGCPDTNLIKSYKLAYHKRIKKLGIDTTAFSDGYTVPEADFVNRDNIEYEQKAGILTLHIRGGDNAVALDRFNIWVNESPIFGVKGFSLKSRHNHKIDTTITITLSQGKNSIETSITNVNATESYRKPLIVNYTPSQPTAEKVYFVGIGIDRFHDNSNPLQWSVKDIRDQANALKEKFGDDCIIMDTLFNERVTTANVKALKERLRKTTVNDKVIIAYSAHGLFSKDYDYFLSTYNINFSKPEEGGLAYDELENLLDSIPARKKLLLLDACHSGEVDKEELTRIRTEGDGLAKRSVRGLQIAYDSTKHRLGSKNSFELMQSLFVNVGRNTGTIIISAAGGTQFAYEKGELKNGVFTYCILEEMKKQHIPVSLLQQNVSARVSELTSGLQVPTSRSEVKNVDWEVW